MKRIAILLIAGDLLVGALLAPACLLAVGALKFQIMGRFEELRQSGAVCDGRLSAVQGWDDLPGTPLQKAQVFLLADACSFFTRSAVLASLLLLGNGVVLVLWWREHRFATHGCDINRGGAECPPP